MYSARLGLECTIIPFCAESCTIASKSAALSSPSIPTLPPPAPSQASPQPPPKTCTSPSITTPNPPDRPPEVAAGVSTAGAVLLSSGQDAVFDIKALPLFSDPDGEAVTSVSIVEGIAPTGAGSITLQAGLVTYTPTPGFTGDARFSLKGCNTACSGAVPVRITVGEQRLVTRAALPRAHT